MINLEKMAKLIRIVTVPPVLVIFMFTVLYSADSSIFHGIKELGISLLFLAVFPILAYPLQRVLKKWKDKGREGQRTLAFICSIAGYLCAVFYGIFFRVSDQLLMIYFTYLLSVFLLTVLNKIFKVRASGHACSIVAPFLILTNWGSAIWGMICLVIAGLSFWASVRLKRHLPSDLLFGSMVCLLSFGVAWWLIMGRM